MRDSEFQKRLLETFRVEAREHIDGMSAGLIDLEKARAPERQAPIIESVFRKAHSLKGAARAVNAAEIESICRSLEGLFAKLKHGEIRCSAALLDTLHDAVDALRQLLDAGPAPGEPEQQRARAVLEQLDQALKAPASPPTEVPPAPPPVAPAEPARASPEPPMALPETIRIATTKLDSVLFQAEEMLAAKLAAGQRVAELSRLQETLAAWQKEWAKARAAVRPLEHSLRAAGPPGQAGQPARKLLEFLEWNRQFIEGVQKEFAATAAVAANDQRALSGMVDHLLDTTKEALMLPFSSLFGLLPKMVRDLSREQGKEAELHVQGGDTEVDRRVLEEMKEAFLHLVRNSIDHGIEPPAERRRKDKAPRGAITVTITQKAGGHLEITVADDGAGIDPSALRAAAVQSGFRPAGEVEKLSDQEALSLIFESGFSTVPMLTDLSGRGLGLAIVREKVEKLGGTISLETRRDAGATFRLVIPSALARFRGVLVKAAGQFFVLPSAPIQRIVQVGAADIQTVENRETIPLDGGSLALARLPDVLELPASRPAEGAKRFPVLVLAVRDVRLGFLVDEVLAEQEVLMKNLGKQLARVRNVAGATVLGDGRVVPILNVHDLAQSALKAAGAPPKAAPPARQTKSAPKSVLVVEDSITSRTLLKNILRAAGYKVETAVDGQDALTALRSHPFDLLVSDVDMPRLNGFDLTAKIRGDPRLANLPVVLVTGLESRADKERGIDVGANAYVVKSSFDQSDLLAVISRLAG